MNKKDENKLLRKFNIIESSSLENDEIKNIKLDPDKLKSKNINEANENRVESKSSGHKITILIFKSVKLIFLKLAIYLNFIFKKIISEKNNKSQDLLETHIDKIYSSLNSHLERGISENSMLLDPKSFEKQVEKLLQSHLPLRNLTVSLKGVLEERSKKNAMSIIDYSIEEILDSLKLKDMDGNIFSTNVEICKKDKVVSFYYSFQLISNHDRWSDFFLQKIRPILLANKVFKLGFVSFEKVSNVTLDKNKFIMKVSYDQMFLTKKNILDFNLNREVPPIINELKSSEEVMRY